MQLEPSHSGPRPHAHPRKVCVVVTARASYARIRTALESIKNHPDLELQLVGAASLLQPPGEVWRHLLDTVLADYVLNSLSLMVGGDAAVLERARPVFKVFARDITHTGAIGSGQAAKLARCRTGR